MEKNKKTKLKNHDDENYNNREKFTETMLSLYGVEHPLQNEKIKEKAVNTYYKLHGYHHALQNIDLINNIKAQYNGIGFGSKLINEKIQNTNLKLYGTINPMQNKIIYNKSIVTLKDKYGVNNAFLINPSTGKRISKVQRKLYDYILSIYPDALLEYYLTDIDLSVDIYIPSIKTVVEMYGDYWHCNPVLFDESYYHSFIKMSAKDIWTKDKIREDKITDNNYRLIIIWENQVNNIIKHKYIQ
jgi:G:T-mismatch repair DNA endonuclease (very short patch repair protein)